MYVDGSGGERRPVVEGHPLAQVERVHVVGGVDVPRLGQARRDLDGVGVVLVLDQTLIGIDHDRGAVVGVVDVGVRRLADVTQQADGQGAVGRG
jgi:hypothetical protein